MSENTSEQFIYRNPHENKERGEDPLHTIDLVLDGTTIGRAETTYYSKPFPLYQVSEIYVEPDYQGVGRGSGIMEQVEVFLKEKKKAGVIVDAILLDSPASGMYQRRGWLEVPDEPGLFAYNLPKGTTVKDLRGYSQRYTHVLDRESWKGKIENE